LREALRRYFVDGRIVVTAVAEGHYVADGRFLPPVALVDPALDLAPQAGATVLAVLWWLRGRNYTWTTGITVPVEVRVA